MWRESVTRARPGRRPGRHTFPGTLSAPGPRAVAAGGSRTRRTWLFQIPTPAWTSPRCAESQVVQAGATRGTACPRLLALAPPRPDLDYFTSLSASGHVHLVKFPPAPLRSPAARDLRAALTDPFSRADTSQHCHRSREPRSPSTDLAAGWPAGFSRDGRT